MNAKDRKAALDAYRADPHHDHKTQFYGILKPTKAGEVVLTVYAVSDTKTHGVRVVEVNRGRSDRETYQCKNLWRNVWGTLMVEFDEKRNGPHESWMWYEDRWGESQPWTDEMWLVKWVRYANLDALGATRYRFSGFADYRGDLPLVPYLQLYRRFPQVEILSKRGLSQFVTPRFLEWLAGDKGREAFLRQHAQEARAGDFTPWEVMRAHAHGWTLEQARRASYSRRRDLERESALKQAAFRINNLLRKARERLARKVGEFEVVIPTTRAEFRVEGREMQNCIARYFEKCADGRTVCAFIRRNGERVADMECTPAGRLVQCRTRQNGTAPKEVEEFARRVAKTIAAALRKPA